MEDVLVAVGAVTFAGAGALAAVRRGFDLVGRDIVAPSVTLELHLRRETLDDRAGLVRLLRVQRERCLALLACRTGRRTAAPAAAA